MNTLEGINYNIKRSNRKTISIYVERDGSVSVLAPQKMEAAELEAAIESKAYLLHKHLAEWEILNRSRVIREYVNGQSFLYLGRNYRLQFVEAQDVPLKLGLLHQNWQFEFPLEVFDGSQECTGLCGRPRTGAS